MAEISCAAAADGTVIYVVDHAASELPPVRGRDILAAWELACDAARHAVWDGARAFRFRCADGGWTDLALHDRDAMCWAGAVDRFVGMQTGYGMSVCLRLLALVELLVRAPWISPLVSLDRRGTQLHPALLRLAAESRLTDEARFDEAGFRAGLHFLPSCAGMPPGADR
jgi:hypothetical protein